MSEAAAQALLEEMSLRDPEDMGLVLIDLTHPDMEDLHVAADNRDHTAGGLTYVGWPCLARFPKPSGSGGGKRGQLIIQDVDPRISAGIKQLSPDAEIAVSLRVVARADTADVWFEHGGLFMDRLSGDDGTISGDLRGHGQEDAPWPGTRRATPKRAPALFVV